MIIGPREGQASKYAADMARVEAKGAQVPNAAGDVFGNTLGNYISSRSFEDAPARPAARDLRPLCAWPGDRADPGGRPKSVPDRSCGRCCVEPEGQGWQASSVSSRRVQPSASCSAFAGFRFPREIIVMAVRWYLRFGLSYRDVAELLVERGVEVDHVTIYRWVQRFTPLLAAAARLCRRPVVR
jgi:hypothetical protein